MKLKVLSLLLLLAPVIASKSVDDEVAVPIDDDDMNSNAATSHVKNPSYWFQEHPADDFVHNPDRTDFWVLNDAEPGYFQKCIESGLNRQGYHPFYLPNEPELNDFIQSDRTQLPAMIITSFPVSKTTDILERMRDRDQWYVYDEAGRFLPIKTNHLCAECSYILVKQNLREAYQLFERRRENMPEYMHMYYKLPEAHSLWRREADSSPVPEYEQRWIVKPFHGGSGYGHQIHDKAGVEKIYQQLRRKELAGDRVEVESPLEVCMVQKIIENPLLIDGHKWDIRVIGLVTSIDPPLVWTHENCMGMVGRDLYDHNSLDRLNFVINARPDDEVFERWFTFEDDNGAVPTDMRRVVRTSDIRRYFEDNGIDWSKIDRRMSDIVMSSFLLTVAEYGLERDQKFPQLWHESHVFEHFGWDFGIDEDLNAWLYEVNYEPEMKARWGRVGEEYESEIMDDEIRLVAPNPPVFRFGNPYKRKFATAHAKASYESLLEWIGNVTDVPVEWCTREQSLTRLGRLRPDEFREDHLKYWKTLQHAGSLSLDDPLEFGKTLEGSFGTTYPPHGWLIDFDDTIDMFECLSREDVEEIVSVEEQLRRRGGFKLATYRWPDTCEFATMWPSHRSLLLCRWFELSRGSCAVESDSPEECERVEGRRTPLPLYQFKDVEHDGTGMFVPRPHRSHDAVKSSGWGAGIA